LLGTAAVAALTAWGARFVGRWEALLGAALLAFSSWAIIHDHYITVDGPSALFGILALFGAMQVVKRGEWRDYIIVGVLIGLAAGTKYQNVLVAGSVALAHVLRWRRESIAQWPKLAAAGGISAVVFLMTTPYIVLAPDDFLHDMQTLFTSYDGSHGDITRSWPVDSYLRFYWRESLQPIGFMLAVTGGIALFRRDWKLTLVLLFFPLLLIISLLRPETHFYRNLLPTHPPFLLLAGVGGVIVVQTVGKALGGRLSPRWRSVVKGGVILSLVVPFVWSATTTSLRFAQPDSRVVAQTRVRQAYPGVRVASELSHPLQWQGVSQSTYVHFLPLHPMEWYHEQGFGLLLANEGKRKQEAWTDAYAPLLEAGGVVATFGGRDSGMLGPRIDLIETHLTTESLPSHIKETVQPESAQSPHLGPLTLVGAAVGHRVKETTGFVLHEGKPVPPGKTVGVNIFWTVDEAVPSAPYMLFLHMRDADGRTIAQRDTPPWQGLFPPETWPPHHLIAETLDLWLPYEVPPGRYEVVMGLYNGETMARFPAFQGQTHLAHDELSLGTVVVQKE
jgi:hypothetical protein